MLSSTRVVPQTSTQAWDFIQKDYTLRLSLFASEWAEGHLSSWNAVFAEGRKRRNAGYVGSTLVEMEIADANKRAQWAYQTSCEIWDIQGRTKSRVFFRAVFECCLQPMFSVREGCFKSELELCQKRTSAFYDLSMICGHMKREMDKTRAKWNTKLEIAARDYEHEWQPTQVQELRKDRTPAAPVPAQISAVFGWKELETRFRNIQSKAPTQDKVSALFTATESRSGSVTEEWRVVGNPACRVEFEQLATIAARKLGYATSENAITYWLSRVREWMQREKLDKSRDLAWLPTGYEDFEGHRNTAQHLFTERISDLSAMFCTELIARDTPESALSRPSERSEAVVRPLLNTYRSEIKRAILIQLTKNPDASDLNICRGLDADGAVEMPKTWSNGRPGERQFVNAYRDASRRRKIEVAISKVRGDLRKQGLMEGR
ncbi:hypothetical protein RBB79_05105 [Tunturiibacter empetritectus]|uniref:Uncharacterized protein n=1 Tax=Tunturiibacter lichenicola TaxID=2051959 RepID=A0A852VHC3_9BACT|nr:hypothetical protein [Edaphobacter lichenicola]NYF88896.1 hypothetical protein [Edaphobacter lichenicola]